jgi:hypothetical protein
MKYIFFNVINVLIIKYQHFVAAVVINGSFMNGRAEHKQLPFG